MQRSYTVNGKRLYEAEHTPNYFICFVLCVTLAPRE